jgi:ferrous iron transport protein A
MPITMANVGDAVEIRKITGLDEVRQHLAELGFVVDEHVTVIAKNGESLILKVKESRVALSKNLAQRIQI